MDFDFVAKPVWGCSIVASTCFYGRVLENARECWDSSSCKTTDVWILQLQSEPMCRENVQDKKTETDCTASPLRRFQTNQPNSEQMHYGGNAIEACLLKNRTVITLQTLKAIVALKKWRCSDDPKDATNTKLRSALSKLARYSDAPSPRAVPTATSLEPLDSVLSLPCH